MASGARYLLMVNAAHWGESFDAAEAVNDIYNDKTRAGGLSAWRVESDEERRAAVAILVSGRRDPLVPKKLSVIEVPEDRLRAAGLLPEHTPEGTRSSHAEARRMHFDFHVGRVERHEAERLCAEIQAATATGLVHFRKPDLATALSEHVDRFSDNAVRQKIRDALATST